MTGDLCPEPAPTWLVPPRPEHLVLEAVTASDLVVFDRVVVGHVVWTVDTINIHRGFLVRLSRLDFYGKFVQIAMSYSKNKTVVRVVEPWNEEEE